MNVVQSGSFSQERSVKVLNDSIEFPIGFPNSNSLLKLALKPGPKILLISPCCVGLVNGSHLPMERNNY